MLFWGLTLYGVNCSSFCEIVSFERARILLEVEANRRIEAEIEISGNSCTSPHYLRLSFLYGLHNHGGSASAICMLPVRFPGILCTHTHSFKPYQPVVAQPGRHLPWPYTFIQLRMLVAWAGIGSKQNQRTHLTIDSNTFKTFPTTGVKM